MSVNKPVTLVLRGKAMFAKILGDPIPNYNKDGKEWKMDFVLQPSSIKELKEAGIGDRVKTKIDYLEGAPFLSFKHKFVDENTKPIKVVDVQGNEWDQKKLIGNGSDVDVKFVVMDFGPGKKKGVYIRSVRVLKLVPYERKEFDELSEDDEFYQPMYQDSETVASTAEVLNVEEDRKEVAF